MTSKTCSIRTCLYFNECGKKEITNGRWKESWRKYKEGFICLRHYAKLISNPKRPKGFNKKYNDKKTKEYRKKYNDKWNPILSPRRIRFIGKRFLLDENPRTGYCSLCSNNIFDKSCKKTDMHHWFYVPILPWACTEEICSSCHFQETWRMKK